MNSTMMRGLLLALYTSTGSILVFAHGFFSAGSMFTAVFISLSTLAMFLSSRWETFTIDPCDFLFAALVCCILISFRVNEIHGDFKEIALLLLSLGGYPAARLLAGGKTIAPSFVLCTATIAIIGAAITVPALPAQWNNSFGKPHPVVFGEFGAATIQFAMSLGFLAIALACVQLTKTLATLAGFLVIALTMVFAISFVRFSFVAIVVALAFAFLTSQQGDKKYVATMILLVIAGVLAGNAARLELAPRFAKQAAAIAPSLTPRPALILARADESAQRPLKSNDDDAEKRLACPTIDLQDSIAIRKQLYMDALAMLPRAGLFGIGMDRFMERSCIKDSEIHNSVLQMAVELGWIAGALLAALIVVAGGSIWRFAYHDAEARFAFCALAFVIVLSMGHGRVSRDALVFFFLGYATSVRALSRRRGGQMNPASRAED